MEQVFWKPMVDLFIAKVHLILERQAREHHISDKEEHVIQREQIPLT